MIIIIGVLIALTSTTPHAAADVPGSYEADRAAHFVDAYAVRHGLPGASYVVVRDGVVVTEGAAGGLATDTRLSVGSVSKSFTAFAVLQLVDQGKVDLDAPITQYIGDFTVRGVDPQQITLRRLLSHTSGLPNPLLVEDTGGSLRQDVANIADRSVASAPGSSYLYSNLNYWTLARMVEVVSGTDFVTYQQKMIFEPLGMADTTSATDTRDAPELSKGHVTAYGTSLALGEMAASIGGAGGVISTAHDMGLWLAMQQRGGVAEDGDRLLSAALVEESHRIQPNARTYGFGWQHTSSADPARIGHDGSLTRFSGRQDLVPSNGYATAVLLDSYTPSLQHPFEISTGLIDISQGREPDLGTPVATIIDVALGFFSLLWVALGVRGFLRAPGWIERRRSWPWWRFALRLLPQLIMPIIAAVLFLGLTTGNASTPVDAFGLWPAAMMLVLVAAMVGFTFVVTRTVLRVRSRS